MHLHTHSLPLINITSSEAPLTFASCLYIIQPFATILFLPLSRVSLSAFPLTISSPSFSCYPLLSSAPTHPPTHMYGLTNLCTCQRISPHSISLLSSPPSPQLLSSVVPSSCEIRIGGDAPQRYTNRISLGSLELINGKVAALDQTLSAWELPRPLRRTTNEN